ncbi:peptidoglycan-binding protein [Streptomyces sp. NBC_00433]
MSSGPRTTRAVTRPQQEAGVAPDGVVGPQTWQAPRR